MSGYVRAQRDRFEHPIFRASKRNPFCNGYAWDWMIAKAAWRETTYDVRGKTIVVKRGQFVASPDEMAEAWAWSRSAVIRFLVRLQTEHMIGQETGHNKTLITICNYEIYQADAEETGQKSGRNNGHKPDTNRTAKEEGEKGKKVETEVSTAREDARTLLAEVVGDDLAVAFLAHRKALKAPMTDHAAKLMAKKLATMSDPGAAVEQSIAEGWKGVFPLKSAEVHPFPSKGQSRGERYRALSADLDARLAERPFD